MNIVGERVYLRAIELQDAAILLDIINDPESEHALGGWSFPISNITQENWIKSLVSENTTLRCMIIDMKTNEAVGTVILSDIDYKNGNAEVHIKLSRSKQGKGYGTEAVRTLVKYAFEELRLKCLYAKINEYNMGSQMLFEKCSFTKDGVLRKKIFKKGSYHDVYLYSLINEV